VIFRVRRQAATAYHEFGCKAPILFGFDFVVDRPPGRGIFGKSNQYLPSLDVWINLGGRCVCQGMFVAHKHFLVLPHFTQHIRPANRRRRGGASGRHKTDCNENEEMPDHAGPLVRQSARDPQANRRPPLVKMELMAPRAARRLSSERCGSLANAIEFGPNCSAQLPPHRAKSQYWRRPPI